MINFSAGSSVGTSDWVISFLSLIDYVNVMVPRAKVYKSLRMSNSELISVVWTLSHVLSLDSSHLMNGKWI